MSYTIILPGNGQESLNKLPSETKERIIQKIYSIRDDPFRSVIPVKGTAYYRLRVGNFRVIMTIERGRMIIIVLKVNAREKVYDQL